MLEQAVGGNGGHSSVLAAVSPLLGKAQKHEKQLFCLLGSEGRLLFIGVIKLTCVNEPMQQGSGKNKQGSNTTTSQIRRSGYMLERR